LDVSISHLVKCTYPKTSNLCPGALLLPYLADETGIPTNGYIFAKKAAPAPNQLDAIAVKTIPKEELKIAPSPPPAFPAFAPAPAVPDLYPSYPPPAFPAQASTSGFPNKPSYSDRPSGVTSGVNSDPVIINANTGSSSDASAPPASTSDTPGGEGLVIDAAMGFNVAEPEMEPELPEPPHIEELRVDIDTVALRKELPVDFIGTSMEWNGVTNYAKNPEVWAEMFSIFGRRHIIRVGGASQEEVHEVCWVGIGWSCSQTQYPGCSIRV
jgi:hypothetical protein